MGERVLLAGVLLPKSFLDEEDELKEFETLAVSAGSSVVGRMFQHREKFDPAFGIGKGKVDEIALEGRERRAQTILFFNDLTSVQQRNLEKATGLKVVDRTAVILDIFAQRARTREGKLQVELAQLGYALTHLMGMGGSLSRLGGGIGTRGPGEQKLETDRRRILKRVGKLEEEIEKVRRHRRTLREGRKRSQLPVVSLVGYTNAGKTCLLNALTDARAYVASQYFATVDPLVRRMRLSDQETILLTDTVGFLYNFPPGLAAAFRATLEELEDADLLVHVVDGSHPQLHKHVASVGEILGDLHLEEKKILFVLNKKDLLSSQVQEDLKEEFPESLFVSALTGEGLKELKEAVKNSVCS